MNYLNLMNLEYIYLDSITEPSDNHLRLTFNRSKTNTVLESIDFGGNEINNVNSIDIVSASEPIIKEIERNET